LATAKGSRKALTLPLPSGPGRSPAAKEHLMRFGLKNVSGKSDFSAVHEVMNQHIKPQRLDAESCKAEANF